MAAEFIDEISAFGSGESTVEIGAHYFAEVLGLKPHLMDAQLKKFGFRFFISDGRRDIDRVTEVGASRPLPTGSWQIDRGLFENHLAEEAQRRGVRFESGARVRRVELERDAGLHGVEWQRPGEPLQHTRARWVVDACGRAGLLKRQLGLARENDHAAHSVWFRVRHRIDIDGWSQDPAWRARCDTATRWLSSNHLVGDGYWVWLIPLASGSHSVGIVADPAWHASEGMDSFDKAVGWLQRHQPQLWDIAVTGGVAGWPVIALVLGLAVMCYLAARFIPLTGEAAPQLEITKNPLISKAHLLRDLQADRRLWVGGLITSWFWTVGAVALSLMPTLMKDRVGGTESVVTLGLIAFTIGIAAGSGMAARASKMRPNLALVPLGAFLMAIFALDLGWAASGIETAASPMGWVFFLTTPTGLRLTVDLVGLAIAGGLFIVPSFAAVQAWAPADRRARVIAGGNLLNSAFYPAPDTIVALDPDIPPASQRIAFVASAMPRGLRWTLNATEIAGHGARVLWAPVPGRHVLALEDANGVAVSTAAFEVRGSHRGH